MQSVAQRDAEILFQIVTSPLTLANGSNMQTVTIPAENAFELHAITGRTDQDAVGNVTPNNMTVLIKTDASNIEWMNNAIPQALICGVAQHIGFVLPRPIIYPPKTTFQITMTNITAVSAIMTVMLIGYRLKNPPSSYGV
jgi:hypothetical protein